MRSIVNPDASGGVVFRDARCNGCWTDARIEHADRGTVGPAMSGQSADLDQVAYDVADEYRDGRLAALCRGQWNETWRNLIEEIRRRCPGRSDAAYDAALNRGFTDSR